MACKCPETLGNKGFSGTLCWLIKLFEGSFIFVLLFLFFGDKTSIITDDVHAIRAVREQVISNAEKALLTFAIGDAFFCMTGILKLKTSCCKSESGFATAFIFGAEHSAILRHDGCLLLDSGKGLLYIDIVVQ